MTCDYCKNAAEFFGQSFTGPAKACISHKTNLVVYSTDPESLHQDDLAAHAAAPAPTPNEPASFSLRFQ